MLPNYTLSNWNIDFYLTMYIPDMFLTQVYSYFDDVLKDPKYYQGMSDIYYEGMKDGTMCVLMKLNKVNMQDFLEEHKYSAEEILILLLQICYSIDHLYKNSIAYVDIKPDNFMLKESSYPLDVNLIDFGCITPALYSPIVSGGNINHRPPEFKNVNYDTKISYDYSKFSVYSIGILAYELAGLKENNTSDFLKYSNPFSEPKYNGDGRFNKDADIWEKVNEFAKICTCADPTNRPTSSGAIRILQEYLFGVPQYGAERAQAMNKVIDEFYRKLENEEVFEKDMITLKDGKESLKAQMIYNYIIGE